MTVEELNWHDPESVDDPESIIYLLEGAKIEDDPYAPESLWCDARRFV